tara:strand:- start:225 stop:449 length:225 start_codon:yes stop_codon:yes gene_type:complete
MLYYNNLTNRGKKNMTKFEKEILKRCDVFLKMFYTILIFAFDSSTYKSKSNEEIKQTLNATNERIKTMSDSYDV